MASVDHWLLELGVPKSSDSGLQWPESQWTKVCVPGQSALDTGCSFLALNFTDAPREYLVTQSLLFHGRRPPTFD